MKNIGMGIGREHWEDIGREHWEHWGEVGYDVELLGVREVSLHSLTHNYIQCVICSYILLGSNDPMEV